MYPSHAQTSENLDPAAVAIISHGVQRSGSTWIYQILCDLYPLGSVVKTHNYLDLPQSIPVISTYRDFRDCAVSHWRQRNPGRDRMTREEVFLYAGMYQHTTWILDQYAKRRHAAAIRYETALAEPEYIFTVIQSHLGMHVAPGRRSEILAAHSMEANRRKMLAGEDPKFLLPNHIHEGEPGAWKRFVNEPDLLTDLLEPQLRQWGYL